MRLALVLAIIACASCNSGGGGPPANLLDTHRILLGTWGGTAISVRQGQQSTLFLRIQEIPGRTDQFAWDLNVSGSPCVSLLAGTLSASGDRITMQGTSFPRSTFVGAIVQLASIAGEYEIHEGLCGGDRGTIQLAKLGPAMLGARYEYTSPDWFIQIDVTR